MLYEMIFTRDITESVRIQVVANGVMEAHDKGYEKVTGDSDLTWEVNSGRSAPYLGGGMESIELVEHTPVMPALVKLFRYVQIDVAIDWVITAIEGGITYWAGRFEYEPQDLYEELQAKQIPGITCGLYTSQEFWERGGALRIFDLEVQDGKEVAFPKLLTMDSIVSALPLLPTERVDRLLDGQYDAEDADVLIQYAILGEVVFG
jgi:hypothetical protein